LRVDSGRALVEVQAGATWKSLAACLRPGDARAQEVRTTRSTIAGSIDWNAAGPDGRPAVAHVESLSLVTPDGQVLQVSRIVNPQLFALVVGGQGLFGVLYSVTLRLESLSRALNEAQAPQMSTEARSSRRARVLQLLVPPRKLEAFLAGARERCTAWRIPMESMQLRRTRQEAETFLCWAQRDYDEVGIGICERATIGAAVRVTQLRNELIDMAIAHGGGFPIACTPEATRSQTEQCYPQLGKFLAEQRRLDPQEKMVNAWLRHQRSLFGREACDVRWNR
jgi:FAD/FMN-containing dehydrogenase